MNASELLRIVDAIHRDKNIDKEIVFQAIEAAFVSAAKKHTAKRRKSIVVQIDRQDGSITRHPQRRAAGSGRDGKLGRIGAQTAKQVMIQKIREAERDALLRRIRRAARPAGHRRRAALRRRRGHRHR